LNRGNAVLVTNGERFEIKQGDTVLVPAQLNNFALQGNATLLEVFINKL